MATYKSDKRLYVNADRSKVVSEDSPEAAYLLVSEGGEIPEEEAKRYGLVKSSKMATAEESGTKARSAPPENKARSAPREVKE